MTGSKPHDIDHINVFLQHEHKARQLREVAAVEAARWLDLAGLLMDSPSRPGLPLRNLLRERKISAADQRPPRPYGRWLIVSERELSGRT